MADNEQLRFGIEGGLDHRRIYLNVPPETYGRVALKHPDAIQALNELTGFKTPAVRRETLADKTWHLELSSHALSDSSNQLSKRMTLLGLFLTGLDQSTEPHQRDPAIRVVMSGEHRQRTGDYQLEALVAWPWGTGYQDTALANNAKDVADSVAASVHHPQKPSVSVSRREGVTILASEAPDKAGVSTGAEYKLPDLRVPASRKFVAKGFGLRLAAEPLICIGGLIAIAHPEDIQDARIAFW